MIDINITFIVQIFHFLIAYVLLRNLLWRPVVARMNEYEKHNEELNKELHYQVRLGEDKKNDIAQVWQQARESFSVHAPTFAYQALAARQRAIQLSFDVPHVSSVNVREIADIIVEKACQ